MRPDRRAMVRFDLALQAELSFPEPKYEDMKISCEIKNICAGGAYFVTPQKLPVGSSVTVVLDLSVTFIPNSVNSRIEIKGKVLRKEMNGFVVLFNKNYQQIKIEPQVAKHPAQSFH